MGFVLLDLQFYMYVLQIVVCLFVLCLLSIVLYVLLRYTDYDCPFSIFKLFFLQNIAHLALNNNHPLTAGHIWVCQQLVCMCMCCRSLFVCVCVVDRCLYVYVLQIVICMCMCCRSLFVCVCVLQIVICMCMFCRSLFVPFLLIFVFVYPSVIYVLLLSLLVSPIVSYKRWKNVQTVIST